MSKSTNPRIIRLCVAAIMFGAAYGFGSWAVDTGSWLLYFLTAVLGLTGLNSFVKSIKNEQE